MSQYQQRIGADRRVHRRVEDARASLVELGGDNSGIVLNISEGGMAILSAEDLDVNSLRNLRFQAPEFEHWIETAADLAWISDSRKEAGIRFKDLSETTRIQLRAGISIATVRARRANQAMQADTTTEDRQEVLSSMPSSIAAADSTTLVAADSATVVATESESAPNVADEVNSSSLVEETRENETSLKSGVREAAPRPLSSENVPDEMKSNSPLEETHEEKAPANSDVQASRHSPSPEVRREREPAERPEDKPEDRIDTKENVILPQQPKKDTRTGRLDLSDIKSIKPQKTATAVALDAQSSPLPPQKNALAEIRFRNLVANSGVRQAGDPRERITNRADISYGKWAAVTGLALVGSLLAFLVGWLLGNPAVIKLRH